jgi:hypothetical protein
VTVGFKLREGAREGAMVSSNLHPATNPPRTSQVSGHGSFSPQHPRYKPPQKL